jgi:hypothetical protein
MDDFPVKIEGKASYEKKNILHTARFETDTLKRCEPKIIRKRVNVVGEKVFIIHYKHDDDYTIKEL